MEGFVRERKCKGEHSRRIRLGDRGPGYSQPDWDLDQDGTRLILCCEGCLNAKEKNFFFFGLFSVAVNDFFFFFCLATGGDVERGEKEGVKKKHTTYKRKKNMARHRRLISHNR